MPETTPGFLVFKRSRFGTRLPTHLRYTKSHYWILQMSEGVWRIGFTKFATRMLGDMVEFQFEPQPGDSIELGQKVGSIEGFKAMSDIYSVASGTFSTSNALLRDDITLIESDPYGDGWLYEVQGSPEPDLMDASGYAIILNTTIDKLLAGRHDAGADE